MLSSDLSAEHPTLRILSKIPESSVGLIDGFHTGTETVKFYSFFGCKADHSLYFSTHGLLINFKSYSFTLIYKILILLDYLFPVKWIVSFRVI